MIAVDTNVLIYACDQADPRRQNDRSRPHHQRPRRRPPVAGRLRIPLRLTKAWQAGIHLDTRLESPRRVPGSTAARPTDRRQSGARKGAPSCTRSVALGCPHPGGVCRSWRRDLLLRGPAGLRRFRGSPRSSIRSSTRGRGGGRKAKARLAPSAQGRLFQARLRRLAGLRSPSRRNPLNETMLLSDSAARTGGALCRPVSAPAQVSQQGWGVSDPASRIADAAPRPSSGVAHAPRVSVEDVLGRASEARGTAPGRRHRFPEERGRE